MKLIICVFLVLVILEEYHCDPCLDFFKRRNKNNDQPKKIGFGLGFSANTIIQGGNGHRREHRHHRYSPQMHPSYSTNGLGHRPWYPIENRHHWNRSPYYPQNRGQFGATYDIPHYRHGTPNITPQYNTPNGWNQASFGPQYGGPQYRTPYSSSFGTGHQIPNSSPNGSPSYTKNTSPFQTPVEIEQPKPKQFFVTPDGIRETPAEPLDNSS